MKIKACITKKKTPYAHTRRWTLKLRKLMQNHADLAVNAQASCSNKSTSVKSNDNTEDIEFDLSNDSNVHLSAEMIIHNLQLFSQKLDNLPFTKTLQNDPIKIPEILYNLKCMVFTLEKLKIESE